MENFISDAIVIEGALFSFLLALFMTWLGLSGLFRMLPATMHLSPPRSRAGVRATAERARESLQREASHVLPGQ
ncbi:MAG TPA: hypothetical protein VFE02_06185 [Candidatus Acidoferrales bacterium]|jgi:hypothetical protein|nr:hypothetical protein [Candidatus Acidoferrales bacterium]